MTRSPAKKPTWSDLKRRLAKLDRAALLGLVKDLYQANKSNQSFLHARFSIGNDVLTPYKATISRWICPDILRNQDVSVSKAKMAISEYKKAVGRPEGLAELSVFYCESCVELLIYCGMDDEGYFYALIQMFEQALVAIQSLDEVHQTALIERLEQVQAKGKNWGYRVGDSMDELLAEYGFAND